MRLVKRNRRQHNRHRLLILRFQRRHVEFRGTHAYRLIAFLNLSANLHHRVDRQFGSGGLIHFAEEHALDGAFQILDGHNRPRIALLRHTTVHVRDQTRHRHLLAVRHIRRAIDQMRDRHFTQRHQNRLHTAQRMVGHIQAKHFTFEIQLGFLIPLLHIGHIHHGIAHARIVFAGIFQIGEQIKLAFGLLAFQTDHRINRSLMNRKQGTTVRIDRIKRTGLDQRFNQSTIQRLHRHTPDEIREIHILAMIVLTFLDNRINRSLANVTDGAKTETHHIADSGILVHRLVHVRRQHLDAHATSLAQIQRGLVFVRTRTLQQRGHEFHRIMRFQICSPI